MLNAGRAGAGPGDDNRSQTASPDGPGTPVADRIDGHPLRADFGFGLLPAGHLRRYRIHLDAGKHRPGVRSALFSDLPELGAHRRAFSRNCLRARLCRSLRDCRHAALRQPMLLFFAMLPFWSNYLIRTYAWIVLLNREGLIINLAAGSDMKANCRSLYTEQSVDRRACLQLPALRDPRVLRVAGAAQSGNPRGLA